MHWRPRSLLRTSARLEDHGPGGEPEPGLVLERRLLLWLPAALLLAPGACRPEAPGPAPRLEFAAFVAAWRALAKGLLADPSRVDRYLDELAALALRIDAVPSVPLTPSRSLGPTVEFGEQLREAPLLATQWRLLPGAGLAPHNHPPFAGVTLGLAGECRLRTYALPEGAPRPPADTPFLVRLVGEERCAPGQVVSAIGPTNNVHETLITPGGARGVDLYVTLNDDRHFSRLTLEEADGGPRAARWGAS